VKTKIKSYKAILEACGCQAKPEKQSIMKHVNFEIPETGYAYIEDDSHDSQSDDHGRMLDYGRTKSDSDEGRRSRQNLYDVVKAAQSLHDKLRDEDDLPQWCAEYIAICADRIGVVEDYLAYKIKRTDG
jgi:hypothetical protein